MLRMKYKLNNAGMQPQDEIEKAVPTINQKTDLCMGQFPSGDWLYGDIDTDVSNKAVLKEALKEFSAVFFKTDQDALDYAETVSPFGVVAQPKQTRGPCVINNDTKLLKQPTTEQW